ncbi:MAG TPA: DUF1015 family protein [Spirochaetota bacterium]|nr:DUF1015 family protein [Spirochaetota bacterium]HOM38852.1 DUF1015 family protein [Spirochaetota bacterium]HPQ49147.1 DUF1015 family protein [Spirochaetota bacterium]
MTLKPFKAIIPDLKYVEEVVAPPYDVISEKEAREVYKTKKNTFLRIGRPEINFPEGTNPYSENVYKKAGEVIEEYLDKGIFKQLDKKVYLIYEQSTDYHKQVGIVGLASVEEYDNDSIKKHELTREDKEKDRTNHIIYTKSHAEPVFIAYRDSSVLNTIIESIISTTEPMFSFNSDGVLNRVWQVPDSIAISIEVGFQEIKNFYIADGHHRAKASSLASKYFREKGYNGEHDLFMVVAFPASQLKIMPYNRVIKSPIDINKVLEQVKNNFDIQEYEFKVPEKKGEFIIYSKGKSYKMIYRGQKSSKVSENLDVAILQRYILDPIFGIKDPRKDKNIDFVGGIKGTEYLKELVDIGEFDYAFSMYPTTIEDLFTVSDSGEIMPPKSTWFEPKLKSGLFLHLF